MFGDAASFGRVPGTTPSESRTTGLPEALRHGLESMSGISLGRVRVHRDSDAPALVDAAAYTAGRDIHLAPGEEHHLPHEAWHVVQQAQGRVRATHRSPEGWPLNDDAGLEREATVMGARSLASSPSSGARPERTAGAASSPAVAIQRATRKHRGKLQKTKLEDRAERGDEREVAPSRADRRRQGQVAELRRIEEMLNRRDRIARASANRDAQEEVHQELRARNERRRAQYPLHEARLARAERNRAAQEEKHEPLRQAAADRAAVQEELAQIEAQRQQDEARRLAPVPEEAPAPALGPADQFAHDHPAAVRIRPMDNRDALWRQANSRQFRGAENFIASTFHKEPRNLTPFEGHPVYHDTQGGGQGGFAIFGVQIEGDRFLIAHGRHTDAGYKIEWSCVDGGHRWAARQTVNFGMA